MKVMAFKVSDDDGTTEVCVVDGQPFYRSTGTNNDPQLAGVWFPFKGFGYEESGITGQIHKHEHAHYVRQIPILKLYPPEVAEQLRSYHPWERFGDMKCLYISYLLSGDHMPIALRAAIGSYIGWIHADFSLDVEVMPTDLPLANNAKSVSALNSKLTELGAILYNPPQPLSHLTLNLEVMSPLQDTDDGAGNIYSRFAALPDYPSRLDVDSDVMNFIQRKPSIFTYLMRVCCCCYKKTTSNQSENVDSDTETQKHDPHI